MKKSDDMLKPVAGPLSRILPVILAHHDKFDGASYNPTIEEKIRLEAQVVSVADVYDSLTSDRPYSKGMSSFDAKEIIAKGSSKDFDPNVVKAFLTAFNEREMEIPEVGYYNPLELVRTGTI